MYVRVVIFLSFLALPLYQLAAQADQLTTPEAQAQSFSSPYKALHKFLEVLNNPNRDPKQLAPLFAHPSYTTQQRVNIAWQLKQVLDGTGETIYLAEIPRSHHYRDTLSGLERYILLAHHPEIYLERHKDGNWIFPARSVDQIIKWHKDVFPWGMEKLLKHLPLLGKKRIGSLYLWQLTTLLILIIIVIILHNSFTTISKWIIPKVLRHLPHLQVSKQLIQPATRALSWTLVCLFLLVSVPVLQLPVQVSYYVILSIRVMLPVFSMLTVYRSTDIFYAYSLKWVRKTSTQLDDQLLLLLRKIFKIFVVALGMLFVLDNLNVPIVPLLTGLSIGGLAFALAAQDTLKNLFGSITIFIDRPFQIGDWITSGEIDGTIEEIGLRSTRVRTFRDSIIYVPNAKLADSMLDNHGLRHYRRYYAQLHLSINTSTAQLEAFVEGLEAILQAHPHSHKTRREIHLHSITKAGIVVMFYIFVKSSSWSGELRIRHELNIHILQLAERLRIAFIYEANTAESRKYLHHTEDPEPQPTPKETQRITKGLFKNYTTSSEPND